MRNQLATLALAIPLAFIVPLLPFMINGAPHIGDAWIHLRIAEETVRLGHYQFTDYNTQWPLINLLLTFTIMILNVPPLMATQIVPILSSLAMLPFYVLCRRLGLSSSSALYGIAFLSYNPLYTYFTFSGAVMKETASYYLVLTLLMIATLKMKRAKEGYLTAALLGLGLVLGHHYAAMIIALFFISLLAYRTLHLAGGRGDGLRTLAPIVVTYLLLFTARNLTIYSSIGLWFPNFTTSDILLLAACLVTLLCLGSTEAKDLLYLRVLVAAGTFVLCVLILRGGVLAVLTPTESITLSEYGYYIAAGVISMFGLAFALKKPEPKSLLVPTAGWILFAFIFSLTEQGLVIFIKALHYFGILLAIGAAFAAQLIHKRFRVGIVISALTIIFVIYGSSFGTMIALRGPGSYSATEFTAMKQIVPVTIGVKLYGDVKANYLWSYLTNGKSSLTGLGQIASGLRRGDLLVVTATNREAGFLLGYTWTSPKAILQRISRYNVLVNSPELNVLEAL